MRYFRLNTVTYGTACAPYLATKCLQHLAQRAPTSQQLGADAIQQNLYVDDCLSGADTLEEAIRQRDQICAILGSENRRPWPENPWTSKAGLFLQFVTLCAFVCLCQNIFIAFLGVSLLLLPCVLLAKCSSRPWSGGLVDIFHRLLLWPQFMMRIGCSALHLPVHILRLTFMVGSAASPGLTGFLG